jgi:hypothetical protein
MYLNTKVTTIIGAATLTFGIFIHENANASQRLVYETFESGGWGVLGHGPTGSDADGTSITTENSHSGSFSAKVNYSNNNNLNHIWYDGLRSKITDELYISFWFYYHPNWQFDYNHKMMRLTNSYSYFNTNHEFLSTDTFFTNGDTLITPSTDCGYSDNAWYNLPSGTYTKGQWHHWEFYGKLNTNNQRNGIFRLWIDGQQMANNTSFSWVDSGCDPQSTTYKWNTVFFPSNYADSPPAGSIPIYYVDDIEIWDGMPSNMPSNSNGFLAAPTNVIMK